MEGEIGEDGVKAGRGGVREGLEADQSRVMAALGLMAARSCWCQPWPETWQREEREAEEGERGWTQMRAGRRKRIH